MTSRDEALRALEKDLRECARASDRAHMTGAAEDFRDAADRLQAILNESDRQEVAPVAWNDIAAWSLASIAEAAGAERDSDDNSTWWTLRIEHFNAMATSPAHTSEARDSDDDPSVQCQSSGSQVLDLLIAGGFIHPAKLNQARHIVAKLATKEDAAMRQEGGQS